jgi:hypothetical protein
MEGLAPGAGLVEKLPRLIEKAELLKAQRQHIAVSRMLHHDAEQ